MNSHSGWTLLQGSRLSVSLNGLSTMAHKAAL